MYNPKTREVALALVIILLVLGTFALAIIDPKYRDTFLDLAKIGIGGYLGMLVPRN